jgi:hypothetical protein
MKGRQGRMKNRLVPYAWRNGFSSAGYVIFFVVILWGSCKSKKEVPVSSPKRNVDEKVDVKSARTLMNLMKKNEFGFLWLTTKFSSEISVNGETHDFTGLIRMRRDSVIWISITAPVLGIEAVRALITKDSVKFMNRIEKNYFAGGYDTISKLLQAELDFDMIQSILVGNSVTFYEEDEKMRAARDRDSSQYILSTIRKRKLKKVLHGGEIFKEPAQSIWLENQSFKISRILIVETSGNRSFDARYSAFKKLDSIPFPHKIDFEIKAEKTLKIKSEYKRTTLNNSETFPFTIPEKYEKIQRKQ